MFTREPTELRTSASNACCLCTMQNRPGPRPYRKFCVCSPHDPHSFGPKGMMHVACAIRQPIKQQQLHDNALCSSTTILFVLDDRRRSLTQCSITQLIAQVLQLQRRGGR